MTLNYVTMTKAIIYNPVPDDSDDPDDDNQIYIKIGVHYEP